MIFWTGFGFMVILLTIVGMALSLLLLPLFGADTYVMPVGILFAAAIVFAFHRFVLMKRETPRELQDPKTGQMVVFRRTNSFMFIPVKFWPYILLVVAGIAFIAVTTRG